ncbi:MULTISPECIES: cytochrome C oxidase subunit IV family protein [Nosocomiicoccus]|uniref:Cytochrome C oxidase subunit IV family protein n=1 Tax=Nosocomiicoccus massiliensis TaxID=1232430 RepID=A0AAF0YID0_9STAP|nr:MULTISPECIES: cytochrome C oxidase subunit IV family protein [Nosocomiicoccus]MDK6863407.1 cytochrome C oxidase subunit IV family protein [Nosocomiicoccus ampullae]OFL48417.1 cytochrome B6 [Nosocomiicoccus sp. HMSC067E10]OFO51195.1 cytochrome B6 [Nosocomiicoccus sp. HMSC059G07]WOS96183.1 cytochrome C oxidase subunit IV family protein [Nosocomiicoccus massiliensis]
MANVETESLTRKELDALYKARAKEMRLQLTSFALMIFMTFIAFGLVALDFNKYFVGAIIVTLAFVQVILQFFYFMHMKDKGHDFAKLFILVGMYFAIAFIITFVFIVWIGTGGIQ